MYKGPTHLVAHNSEDEGKLNCFGTAVRLAADEILATCDEENLCGRVIQRDEPNYVCVKLIDGTDHWVVSFCSDPETTLVSVVASDLETGRFYNMALRNESILSICQYPREMIERMPEEPRPFGFAARERVEPALEMTP